MKMAKRYHPLLMLFDCWRLIKNGFFFVLFLYVINAGSQSPFVLYGRMVFWVIFGLLFISIFVKWFTRKYQMDEKSFHLYQGVLSKSERTIPYAKIQNVKRHTSFFHRLLNVTSIRFETGMQGEEAAVAFEVISREEANQMEEKLANAGREEITSVQKEDQAAAQEPQETAADRIVHFTPSTKDTLKASLTSLSFLVFISVLASFYFKLNDIFEVEEQAKGVFMSVLSTWWLMTLIITLLIIVSIVFGVARTFIKYGKYEISSDPKRIYIKKGVIDETVFSIEKEKVQAIEIEQTLLKRWLGLAEVKLTSAGELEVGENSKEVNSLYPFLPVKRAYKMISEILPSYEVTEKMERLPRKSFWVRMLKPSWLWLAVTAALFYFKPDILDYEQAWWVLSIVLLFLILINRLMEYYHTKYLLNDQFIQLKTGSFTTKLFVSKRDKVIEVSVTRNPFQKMLGLASIGTINRAQPIQHSELADVPFPFAQSFYQWYLGRRKDIKIE
ncbi:PH domain-containing protein [Bacillus xiapuensis]|uniref:PH domain-containing protein n=1 Tax=Bacillus xiapuensis TaxID=2014075 RepID=UPI000C238EB3|nr:PH domain-containing protein [Bacillus xiapuensis]